MSRGALHIETIPIRGTARSFQLLCECRIGRDHDYEEWRVRYSPTLVPHPPVARPAAPGRPG
jgi:hypothetical protein